MTRTIKNRQDGIRVKTVLNLTNKLKMVEYGFDQQGWYGMFVACGIWCLADVSSVSPSSEQTAPTKG